MSNPMFDPKVKGGVLSTNRPLPPYFGVEFKEGNSIGKILIPN